MDIQKRAPSYITVMTREWQPGRRLPMETDGPGGPAVPASGSRAPGYREAPATLPAKSRSIALLKAGMSSG
jgi:hypothetical protein